MFELERRNFAGNIVRQDYGNFLGSFQLKLYDFCLEFRSVEREIEKKVRKINDQLGILDNFFVVFICDF